jgi:hypothetical protein
VRPSATVGIVKKEQRTKNNWNSSIGIVLRRQNTGSQNQNGVRNKKNAWLFHSKKESFDLFHCCLCARPTQATGTTCEKIHGATPTPPTGIA